VAALSQRNVYDVGIEGSSKNRLQQAVRCYFYGDGVLWYQGRGFFEVHGSKDIVGVILGRRELSFRRVPLVHRHRCAQPFGATFFRMPNDVLHKRAEIPSRRGYVPTVVRNVAARHFLGEDLLGLNNVRESSGQECLSDDYVILPWRFHE
jgi:hypothetical protein